MLVIMGLFGRLANSWTGQLGLNGLVWLMVFASKPGLSRPPYASGPGSQKTEGASVFLGPGLR